jgi:hypothetical protein
MEVYRAEREMEPFLRVSDHPVSTSACQFILQGLRMCEYNASLMRVFQQAARWDSEAATGVALKHISVSRY